jgi:hypothetical protein
VWFWDGARFESDVGEFAEAGTVLEEVGEGCRGNGAEGEVEVGEVSEAGAVARDCGW